MTQRAHNLDVSKLSLPPEFEDLTGLIQSDLKVVVSVLAQRASERLLLSRRQTQQFQKKLWNSLADAVNEAVEPLAVERR